MSNHHLGGWSCLRYLHGKFQDHRLIWWCYSTNLKQEKTKTKIKQHNCMPWCTVQGCYNTVLYIAMYTCLVYRNCGVKCTKVHISDVVSNYSFATSTHPGDLLSWLRQIHWNIHFLDTSVCRWCQWVSTVV